MSSTFPQPPAQFAAALMALPIERRQPSVVPQSGLTGIVADGGGECGFWTVGWVATGP